MDNINDIYNQYMVITINEKECDKQYLCTCVKNNAKDIVFTPVNKLVFDYVVYLPPNTLERDVFTEENMTAKIYDFGDCF